MGSTGSGSFTDYSKRRATQQNGSDGGQSGGDICGKGFSSSLDEVSRCFYFINYTNVPPAGTEVRVFFNGLRISVENLKGEEIGYLPTKFNYIKACLVAKFKYGGVITSSSLKPIPSVTVDITPL